MRLEPCSWVTDMNDQGGNPRRGLLVDEHHDPDSGATIYHVVRVSQGRLVRASIPADEAQVSLPRKDIIRSQRRWIGQLIAAGDGDPGLTAILNRIESALR